MNEFSGLIWRLAAAWQILTDLANNLIVFEASPLDLNAVIIPVGPGHMGIDVGIYSRHFEVDSGRDRPW